MNDMHHSAIERKTIAPNEMDTVNPNKRIDTSRSIKESQEVNPNIRVSDAFSNKEVSTKHEDIDPNKRIEKSNSFAERQNEGFDPDKGVEKKDTAEINTRNTQLEGKEHPDTGVSFERKTVKDADGNEVTGVFPVFDSEYDAQLPEDLYEASDKKQFAECNEQLKGAIEKDPELAKKFTPEQLEQIKNGDTPDGYVWHHNEETGKMQLVDSDVHAKTGHTGGKTIWGGGNENR